MMKLSREFQRESILYVCFGVLTYLIDSGSFFLLNHLFAPGDNAILLHLLSIISSLLAISFAYITNRKFVFRSNKKTASAIIGEALRFFGARFFVLLLGELLLQIFVFSFGVRDWIAKCAVNGLVVVLNYLFSKLWIFKKNQKKS